MPAPTPIPFGEWTPDMSDRVNPTSEAKGCISYAGQYAPFPDIQDYGAASNINSNFKMLLHFDGADASTTARDDSPSPKTFTAAGNAQIDTAQSKFGGASALFDGTGDWFTTPDHADFSLGSGAFTIEGWAGCSAASGTTENLAGQAAVGLAAATGAWYIERHTTDVIRAHVSTGAAWVTVTGTTTFVSMTAPSKHIRLIRTGNILRLFIDGVQEGGDVAFTGAVNNSANALRIGAAGEETGNPWTGWIDEFALVVGEALATAAFTPATVPFNFGAGAEDVVIGARAVYDSTTNPHIFFGDDTRLYRLVSRVAVDVSKAAYYTVASGSTWQFAQFGDNVVAVTAGNAPQHYTLGVSVDFADLAGSPPNGATAVARINDFLMMGDDFTVHWSAFNDVTDWVPSVATQAGNQELDQEQGLVKCIIGLDYAAIFQERAIRRANYVGPPVIFDFGQDYIEKARGCISNNGAAAFGRIIYYVADDGFYAFDGQASTPIGSGKVDDYFVRRLNYAYRHKVCVGIDGQRKLVVFGFPAGANQLISELLIYSLQDSRWTHDEIDLEFLFDSPSEPLTLETISSVWGSDIDATSFTDIDSDVYNDRRRRLATFQTPGHQLGLFTGLPRAAIMDTGEFEATPGRRSLVTEIWPLGDMQQGNVSASIGYRKALPGASVAFTNPTQMNAVGFCPQRVDARFMRGRLMLSAGANWRRMEGIHAVSTPTGGR